MTESSPTAPGSPSPRPAADTAYFDAFPDLFDRFTRIWDGISGSFDGWILSLDPLMILAGGRRAEQGNAL